MRWSVLVVAVVVGGFACGKKAADGPCDMSTDDKAAAVYKRLTGKDVETEDLCFRHSKTFPGWLEMSEYAPDAGCGREVMIWQCKKVGEPPVADILRSAGYKTADAQKKRSLLVAWYKALDKAPGAFAAKTKAFDPVSFEDGADGSLTMTYWTVVMETSESGEQGYERRKVTVSADGTPGPETKLDSFMG